MSAKIIDFHAEMLKRFYAWANEYILFGGEGGIERNIDPSVIIAYLIQQTVFTEQEMRNELDSRKISLHENYFKAARVRLAEKV